MAHSTTAGLSRRRLLADVGLAAAGAIALTPSVPVVAGARSRQPEPGDEVATAWADLSLTLVQSTPGFTPPVASRVFAYWGISLYESVVDGSHRHRTLAGLLRGLDRPPGDQRRRDVLAGGGECRAGRDPPIAVSDDERGEPGCD